MIYKQIYFGKKQEKVTVDLTQNSNGQTLIFDSMDWDIPDSASCNIFVNKPDGHLVYNAGTIDGNEMLFAITTQMTAVPGVAECQVQIVTTDEKILNSFVFDMAIEETIIDGTALESTDEYTALEELITQATATIADCQDATQEALDAAGQAREPVRVGARNLIVNTLNPSSGAKPKLIGVTDAEMGNVTAAYSAAGLDLTATASNAYYRFAPKSLADMYCFEAGTQYYVSLKYSGAGTGAVGYFVSTNGTSWTQYGAWPITAATDPQELVKLVEIPSSAVAVYLELVLENGASIRFSDIQLEKATVPAQYRPATEDITGPVLAAQTKLNNLVVIETKSITTTGDYYILSDKTGYVLANAYRVVGDASGHIKSIARRPSGGYTLMFNGITTATTVSIYCVWIKSE